jgi:hypothetical protein
MHAIFPARAAKRFSLLLLDDEEDYVGDWGVDCTRWPPDVPGNWMQQRQMQQQGPHAPPTHPNHQEQLPGRLRLCTKSMFFEPDDVRVPIVRIPFADVTRLEPDDSAFQLEQQRQAAGQPSAALGAARRAPPAAFFVATTSVTRMRAGLQDAPYATDRAAGARTAGRGLAAAAAVAAAAAPPGASSSSRTPTPTEFVWAFSLRYAKLDALLPLAMEQLAVSRLPPLERLQVRTAAAAARQDDARFDPSRLVDLSEAVLWEGPAEQRSPLVREPGRLAVSTSRLYFQPLHDVDGSGAVRSHPLAAVAAVARRRASLRPTGVEVFFLQPPFGTTASRGCGPSSSSSSSLPPSLGDDGATRRSLAEGPFWDAPSAFFALRREGDRDALVQALSSRPVLGAAAAMARGALRGGGGGGGGASKDAAVVAPDAATSTSSPTPTVSPAAALAAARELLEASGGWLPRATAAWRRGAVSNFDYLLLLNLAAGRSFNDLAQWPVFPWILADYAPAAGGGTGGGVGAAATVAAAATATPQQQQLDLSDPSLFRDLSKPVGALTAERLADFRARYRDMLQIEREHAAAKRREREQRAAAAAAATAKSKKGSSAAAANLPPANPDDPDDDTPHDRLSTALPEIPPAFMYGTHYSAPGYVLYWLVRACPGHMLRLQGGRFDAPDRLFCSVAEAWRSVTTSTTDVKELIPEFYMLPSPAVARAALARLEGMGGGEGAGLGGAAGTAAASMATTPAAAGADAPALSSSSSHHHHQNQQQLRDGAVDFLLANPRLALGVRQNGRPVGAVELPAWARGSPALFLATMRAALEAPPVSASLHRWIDLVFGCKQRGRAAAEADNVFYYLTYEGAVDVDALSSPLERRALETQVDEFGQAPRQLFAREHPARLVHPEAPRPVDLLRAVAAAAAGGVGNGGAGGGGGGAGTALGGGGGGGSDGSAAASASEDAGGRALALSLLNSIVAAAAPEMAREAEALARAEAEAAAAAAAEEEASKSKGAVGEAEGADAAPSDGDAATAATDAALASSSRLTGLRGALEGAMGAVAAGAGALASAAAAGLDAAAAAPPPRPAPPPGGIGSSLLATLQYSFARGVSAASAAQGALAGGTAVAGRRRTTTTPPSAGAAAPAPGSDAAFGCRAHPHDEGASSSASALHHPWPDALADRLRVRRAVRLSAGGEPLTAAAGLLLLDAGGGGGGGQPCVRAAAIAGRGGLLRVLRMPDLTAERADVVRELPPPTRVLSSRATAAAAAPSPTPVPADLLCLVTLPPGASCGGGSAPSPHLLLAGTASGRVHALLAAADDAGASSSSSFEGSWAAHAPGAAVEALLALPGARVATAAADGVVRVWDTCARAPWRAAAGGAAAPPAPLLHLSVPTTPKTAVRCLAASPSGQTLVAGASDGTVSVWDLRTGGCVWRAQGDDGGNGGGICGVAVLSGGAHVAAAAACGSLSVHDWRVGGARVASARCPVGTGLRCLASDSTLVLAGGEGGRLFAWDAAASAATGGAGDGGGGNAPQQLLCGSRAAVNAVLVFGGEGGGDAHALAAQDDGSLALFAT